VHVPDAQRRAPVTVQAGTVLSQFALRFKTTRQDIPGIGREAAAYSNFPGTAILARQGSKWDACRCHPQIS
jgi:hypothetical protein